MQAAKGDALKTQAPPLELTPKARVHVAGGGVPGPGKAEVTQLQARRVAVIQQRVVQLQVSGSTTITVQTSRQYQPQVLVADNASMYHSYPLWNSELIPQKEFDGANRRCGKLQSSHLELPSYHWFECTATALGFWEIIYPWSSERAAMWHRALTCAQRCNSGSTQWLG